LVEGVEFLSHGLALGKRREGAAGPPWGPLIWRGQPPWKA
jgi:hypothetical protein